MCGIAGVYSLKNKRVVTEDIVLRMISILKHRGPDESGIYISDNVGLGSVRLSIVDLKSGTMPISNKDKNFWIIFNIVYL